MKKILLIFILLFSNFLFSQQKEEVVLINSNTSIRESLTNKLSYLFTSEKIDDNDLLKSDKRFKPFNDYTYENFSVFEMPKKLYLKGKIKNTTNDTIHLILTTTRTQKTTVILSSKKEKLKKSIGLSLKENESFSNEVRNSMSFDMFPNEEKQILLITDVYLSEDIPSKITLYTAEEFDSMLLNFYKENHSITLWFALLSGGLLLLFFYNLFMYVKSKQKTYLYYSFYLLFTFLNLCLIIDRIQFNLIGNILAYYALIQEATYTLSFIFYTMFVRSMLLKISKAIKKTFFIYLTFMLAYIIYIVVASIYNSLNVTLIDIVVAFLFRITSLAFAVVILLQLLKNYNQQYIKYIFIGSLILTLSYLLHVVFSIINGPKLVNHFYNLIGSLLEILFFTYALHIKTLNIEKEKIQIQNLSEVKAKFFANISHEFRTPLTLIKSPLQLLQSKSDSESESKQLNMIDKNANRMLELVDQLLELSKIDSGNLKLLFGRGGVGGFLATMMEPFELLAEEQQLRFKKSVRKTGGGSYFDEDVLEKIVSNLVTNAIKYTIEKGTIEVKTTQDNDILTLEISNETVDLKQEDISKMFDYFYQKDSNKSGFGIGLTLVKELVDLYQGTIETKLNSKKLHIKINLPLSKENPNAIIVDGQDVDGGGITNGFENSELPLLMLVDDNADIRMILKEIFKDDFKIIEAQDGQEALRVAEKEIPDCIISDVMMPKMDGYEFTKTIKNNELTSFIPIILLTAKTSDEAHLEGLKSTADAFLTKPFNNEIVKATVNQLIAERKKLHKRYSQELVLRPVDIVINSQEEKFIERLQKILDKNLSNSDYSAEDFAAEIGMSRMQLHRKLKSLLGVSSTEFLRNERLKVGAELLKKGNGNISEIAYSVGFNDVSYFSKCFKEMYQCTPTEYIER
jgi:signal transduction histidine kinase/CheY-like chemotaxis protein/AraC-like DNA-binding protein